MSESSSNPLKRPGPPLTDTRRRSTKKSKFKTIETPEALADAISSRDIDRMSVTTSDKGHIKFSSHRRKVYLTPEDMFADSALETIAQDTVETIVQGLPKTEQDDREESKSAKKKRQRAELRASVSCNSRSILVGRPSDLPHLRTRSATGCPCVRGRSMSCFCTRAFPRIIRRARSVMAVTRRRQQSDAWSVTTVRSTVRSALSRSISACLFIGSRYVHHATL